MFYCVWIVAAMGLLEVCFFYKRHHPGEPPVVLYDSQLDSNRKVSLWIINNAREQVSRLIILFFISVVCKQSFASWYRWFCRYFFSCFWVFKILFLCLSWLLSISSSLHHKVSENFSSEDVKSGGASWRSVVMVVQFQLPMKMILLPAKGFARPRSISNARSSVQICGMRSNQTRWSIGCAQLAENWWVALVSATL